MSVRHTRRRARRGSYAALFAAASTVFMGFAALAVDVALVRLADVEAQAVADAAAQAALLRLRATNNRDHAQHMAERVIANNRVSGKVPVSQSVSFGVFDDGVFVETAGRANAVRVEVLGQPPLTFSSFWGRDDATTLASATACAQSLHTVVVMDITNSWNQNDFEKARDGAVEVFDQVTATAGADDRIGMVVFTGQYGTEFTPLMPVSDALADGVRDQWANMRTASKAGTPNPGSSKGCNVYGGDQLNDFSSPEGGCFPQMPREYKDESGTDHAIGIEMAAAMFEEHEDPSIYRAMILLTDGEPNGTGKHEQRAEAGYEDTRWRYKFVGERRGTDEVRAASKEWAEAAWDGMEIHTWAVSYKANATWLEDVAHGDGAYIRAESSSDLEPIFSDIVESLPMALVE